MDEEELLAYHQQVVSLASLILALALSALSVCIYTAGKKLPEMGHHDSSNSEDTHVHVKSAAHMELFSEMWKILSACTILIFSILFIVACALSLGGDAERMREEGSINLLVLLVWMILVTAGVMIVGRQILHEKKFGTLGVGLLSGGTLYYALLLFIVSILFANPTFGGPNDAGGPAAAATSVACFFLSLMHLAFSLGTRKYQKSIMLDARAEMDDSAADGDFQRMEDEPEKETGTEPEKETEMQLV